VEISTHQSHSLFDVESAIVRAGNQPSPVDLTPWQKRIDLIVGRNVVNQPRLRIIWGQDIGGSAGQWICGERRAKYPFWRYEEAGQIKDIGSPRFYIEELHSNSELRKNDAWEKSRYYWDQVTGQTLDVLGPVPSNGFYSSVFCIAYHDELCCDNTGIINNEPCIGAYRPPSDSDIQRIQRMKFRRDHAEKQDVTPSDELIHKRSTDMATARDEYDRRRIRERIENEFKTHAWKFTTNDPSKLKWGKYSFVREGAHSKSGATPEELQKWRGEKNDNSST
jgi:hypothetical protein